MESVLTNWWFIRAVKVTNCYFYTTELIQYFTVYAVCHYLIFQYLPRFLLQCFMQSILCVFLDS